ncbi:hypothetical protein HPB47_013315 [Ixodes persulcatus]|uniref:Uncharacterized protein n=1 Tax=Ixodes persulcatus TaxID=34615 RepID=A0AC60QYU1_IXOPE|nr:hypothetical protein HPB47_013315 [Ixodes persulcatus]
MFRLHMFYSRTPQHRSNPIDLQRPSPKMELARNLTRATRYLPSSGRASQRQFPWRCQDPSANGVPRTATVTQSEEEGMLCIIRATCRRFVELPSAPLGRSRRAAVPPPRHPEIGLPAPPRREQAWIVK